MYGLFMLVGDRLVRRYRVDPRITSLPERPPRRTGGAGTPRPIAEPTGDVERFFRKGGFSG